MQEIQISVVVPCLIRSQQDVEYLKVCLESIEKQTFRPYEIILIDDGSPIVFMNQIKTSVKYVRLDENKGIGNARQEGVIRSMGNYVAFCSADDLWSLDKLKLQKEIAEKSPDDIIYTDYYNCNELGQVISEFKAPYHENIEQMKLEVLAWMERNDMFINFSSILIPKKCLEILPIDKTLRGSEDFLWICCAAKLFEFKYLNKPTVLYRRHPNMTTSLRGSDDLLQTAEMIKQKVRIFWGK